MAELPISAEQYFRDFSFDIMELTIERSGKPTGIVNVLENKHDGARCFEALYGCDIQPGDHLIGPAGSYVVRRIDVDTYQGAPSLVRAFY